jgi:peptidoglycan/LPS O-acetylase OafA/YrhL
MGIFDRIVLLLTGLVAIYMISFFLKRQKNEKTEGRHNFHYMISFLVLLVSGLLLIVFGWDALGNNFVAVVAGLIPFTLATGLVCEYHKDRAKWFVILMLIGLILIAVTRYSSGMDTIAKIVYPVFHAIAGLTIFFLPIFLVKADKVKSQFIWVTVGGTLIGLGGIALAFLTAGKQLLFFSPEFVLMILAPLLFLMALCYAYGFTKGDK